MMPAAASDDGSGAKSSLERTFRKQVGDTACGLASLAVVVDALRLEQQPANEDGAAADDAARPRTTEAEVLAWQRSRQDGGGQEVRPEDVQKRGMTLSELSRLAWNAGIMHACCYADRFEGLGEFRRVLQAALAGPCKVIMNYHMTIAGQSPFGGHFSPLERYDAAADAFRILDVWKLTPTDDFWADAARLWAAAADQDADAQRCRGFIVVAPCAPLRLSAPAASRPVGLDVSEEGGVGVRMPDGTVSSRLRPDGSNSSQTGARSSQTAPGAQDLLPFIRYA